MIARLITLIAPLVFLVEGFRFSEMNERELFKKEAEHRSPWQQRENEILIQSEVDFSMSGSRCTMRFTLDCPNT